EFIHFEVGNEYRKKVVAEISIKDTKNALWVYEYRDKTKYDEESIKAFYFPSGIQSSVLPERYASLVQYVDCMVDTSTLILLPGAHAETFKNSKKIKAFNAYIAKAVSKQPEYKENDKNY